MKKRIITGAVLIALCVPIGIYSGTLALPIVVAALSMIGIFEMYRCIGLSGRLPVLLPALLIGGGMPMLAFFLRQQTMRFFMCLILVAFLYLFYAFSVSLFSHGTLTPESAALAVTMLLYITASFSSIVLLRHMEFGQYTMYLVFIGAWITDIFAYFCGMLCGKHKLLPDVSPKKTVEGALGGVLFCAGAYVLYAFVLSRCVGVRPAYLAFAGIGVIVSVLSQMGDLLMSLIKRRFGIKDYGKIFPGHGGVLDRFDSVLATAPFCFILCAAYHAFFGLL